MLLIGCLGAALLVGCGNEKTDANAGGDTNASVGTEAKADTSPTISHNEINWD